MKINDKLTRKSIITAMLSQTVNMSTSNQYQAFGVSEILTNIGEKFTLSETRGTDLGIIGIKIGRDVSKVKINANLQFTNNNNTSSMYFIGYIYKESKNGSVRNMIGRALTPSISSGGISATATISPLIIDVEENDIIYLRAFKSIASGIATIDPQQRTYLTVEEVE